MAWFKRTSCDKNGKTIKSSYEKYPSELGRWKRNKELDKKDGIKTTIRTRNTKSGLNKVVTSSTSVFPDGMKMKSKLIKNSNRELKNKNKKGR